MKSDIINEAIKKIDADLVRGAEAYGSGSGTEGHFRAGKSAFTERLRKRNCVVRVVDGNNRDDTDE